MRWWCGSAANRPRRVAAVDAEAALAADQIGHWTSLEPADSGVLPSLRAKRVPRPTRTLSMSAHLPLSTGVWDAGEVARTLPMVHSCILSRIVNIRPGFGGH